MSQQEIIIHPEQDEMEMSPTELLEKRLNRVNLALSQLQHVTMSTVTNMQKDVVFSLHVIEALKGFLPGAVIDDAVAAATATVGAYQHTEVAPRPTHKAPAVKLPITPAGAEGHPTVPPVRHPGHSSINEAAQAAKSAVEHLSENIREHLQHPEGHPPMRQPRSLQAATRPTPKQKPSGGPADQASAEQSADDFLGHFLGSGSVFAKYFSPEVYVLGRGFVKPGYGGFGEYEEDVMRIATEQLRAYDYPSGFYTDEITKLLQFYMGNAKMQVTVTNLPNANIDVWVSFAPFKDRQHIRTLSPQAMQVVFGTVSAIFNAGERLATQQ